MLHRIVMICLCTMGLTIAQTAQDTAVTNAWIAASKVLQRGPAQVQLADLAQVQIPLGYAFIPSEAANRLQKSFGNSTGPEMLGMVIKLDSVSNWFMTLRSQKSGHVNDDDQDKLDADDLLKTIKDAQIEDNKRRKSEGHEELGIQGWLEKPMYDKVSHQLLWSLELQAVGSNEMAVNYNIKCLGRDGLISATLVGTVQDVQNNKAFAKQLAANLTYKPGKAYADFDPSTDHVAEYGLIGLIGGGLVLKKLGLFAMIAAFGAKFFKIILVAGAAILVAIKKFLGIRSKKETDNS